MLNRLLQPFYQAPNNGRQIIRLDAGPLLVTSSAVSGPGTIGLSAPSAGDPERMGDFDQRIVLVGTEGTIKGAKSPAMGACALQGADGRLHLAWTEDGKVRHAWTRVEQALSAEAWSGAITVVEGNAWLGDFLLYREQPGLLFQRADSIGMAVLQHGSWSTRDLWQSGPAFPPVGHVDADGRLHLTWGDVPGRIWYSSVSPGETIEGDPFLVSNDGRQPSVVALANQALIVYEDEYNHIRFVVVQDRKVAQTGSLTSGHPWFRGDLLHSAQVSVDRHGVIWCFFVNNTRRSTFWTRWMGEGFGEIMNGPRLYYRPPRFDWNLLPIARLSVEKDASTADIGLLMGLERPLEGQEYRHVPVPDHPHAAGSTVLFFDTLEVGAMKNVALTVLEAERHPDNPLLDVGPSDAFDSERVYNHGTVLKDGDGYRMWYAAIHVPGQQVPWWDWYATGYAESVDGVRWEKVGVGLTEWQGSTHNNLVPHLGRSSIMVRDDGDPDPARRYKSLLVWNAGQMGEMARTGKYGIGYDPREEYYPAVLFTSPDGLHVTPHEARVVFLEGTAKPLSIIPMSLFRDEAEPNPARRWKAYGFMSLNLRRRGTSYLYSADAVTWYAHPEIPVLDPLVRGTPAVVGGPECQIHDTVIFPYKGYYLALFQNQYNADILDIELAASRDGETFVHIKPGTKTIPLGRKGEWDSEYIVPTTPVILENEIRIYYGGGHRYDVPEEERERLGERELRLQPGLARLRRDGFTCMSLCTPASHGLLTTIPLCLNEPCGLRLNAQCDRQHTLRVEVLDITTGLPLRGYSDTESTAITENGGDLPVRWQHTAELPAHTPMCLRFHFDGDPALPLLYSYRFVATQ